MWKLNNNHYADTKNIKPYKTWNQHLEVQSVEHTTAIQEILGSNSTPNFHF